MGHPVIDALVDIYAAVRGTIELWRIHDDSHVSTKIGDTLLALNDVAAATGTAAKAIVFAASSAGGSSGPPLNPTAVYAHVGSSVSRMNTVGKFIV